MRLHRFTAQLDWCSSKLTENKSVYGIFPPVLLYPYSVLLSFILVRRYLFITRMHTQHTHTQEIHISRTMLIPPSPSTYTTIYDNKNCTSHAPPKPTHTTTPLSTYIRAKKPKSKKTNHRQRPPLSPPERLELSTSRSPEGKVPFGDFFSP